MRLAGGLMKSFVFALCAGLACLPQLCAAQTADADAQYQTLLTGARAAVDKGESVDWAQLRYAYAERPSFAGSLPDSRADMFTAAKAGDWAAVEKAAVTELDSAYIDGAAHFLLGAAWAHLPPSREGQAEAAQREKAVAMAIIDSMRTGDGLSHEKAFTVIAVSEEYDLLGSIGVTSETQALDQHDGHMFDVMTTKDKDGKAVVYYFNIDRAWAAEARMLTGGK